MPSEEAAFQQRQETTLASIRAAREESAAFHRLKQSALNAFRVAQEYNRRCRPQSRTRASAELDRCRQICLALSSALPPTASDEELVHGPRGRRRICPSPDSNDSDDEYWSSSSSSSGGSSQRHLEEKEALSVEFLVQPEVVVARVRTNQAHTAAVASTSNGPQRTVHDTNCRSLRTSIAHCNCTLRDERLARRIARREDRVHRWFEAMLREHGYDDAHTANDTHATNNAHDGNDAQLE
ncbi:hypothetical protein C8R47DRAFT_1065114 [Mycena vitilis]|nr:hypothetical protein C8R47DRAFT_1214718 [Mycena vitilis]KAJ6511568.1 hypothetical protein C8R47DRAFT_1065114 [Mycena vitilis]